MNLQSPRFSSLHYVNDRSRHLELKVDNDLCAYGNIYDDTQKGPDGGPLLVGTSGAIGNLTDDYANRYEARFTTKDAMKKVESEMIGADQFELEAAAKQDVIDSILNQIRTGINTAFPKAGQEAFARTRDAILAVIENNTVNFHQFERFPQDASMDPKHPEITSIEHSPALSTSNSAS